MKILIVDDDSLMRIALKTLINWEDLGMTLLGEAADGVEALSIIRREHPDILLLDMKMPRMDGIQLLREIQDMPDRPKTVVLSSYEEFALVKEAMKLGADDYILKMDMDFNNLVEIMGHLTEKILKTRQQTGGQGMLAHDNPKNTRILRGEFYRTLAGRFYSFTEDIEAEMRNLGVRLGDYWNYCFIIEASVENAILPEEAKNLQIQAYAVVNVAEEVLSSPFSSFGFEWGQGEYCILSFPEQQEDRISSEMLIAFGRRLADMLMEYLNLTVYVGIGEGGRGIQGVQQAYDRARTSICNRFFTEDRILLWSEDLQGKLINNSGYSVLNMKDEIVGALAFRDSARLERILDRIASDFTGQHFGREMVGNLVQQLYYIIIEYLGQNAVSTDAMLGDASWPPDRRIAFETVAGAQKYVGCLRDSLIRWLDESDGQGSLEIARNYMREHFAEDISLGKTAAAAGLSPPYLSNLLKKETGKSYSDYLISLRMEKAKKLIETTNYKAYEVGEMVGYLNTFYFARLFKRETGMTPGEYKSSVHNEHKKR